MRSHQLTTAAQSRRTPATRYCRSASLRVTNTLTTSTSRARRASYRIPLPQGYICVCGAHMRKGDKECTKCSARSRWSRRSNHRTARRGEVED